jgi:hypothetical protein
LGLQRRQHLRFEGLERFCAARVSETDSYFVLRRRPKTALPVGFETLKTELLRLSLGISSSRVVLAKKCTSFPSHKEKTLDDRENFACSQPDPIRVRLKPQQNAYRRVLVMVSLERRSRFGRKEVTSHHNQERLLNTLLEIRSHIIEAVKGETEVLSYSFQLIISGARAKY